jgi:ribA/ribD-fused uncharacterized protein
MPDRLCFYSKSQDVLPGKGAGEVVKNADLYDKLAKINNWRKMLSNFHVYAFLYEGHTYNTIEHVFQAKKFELVDREKALLFTIESGDEIGKGDGEVARNNRKLIKLDKDMLFEWSKIRDQVMKDAALAKYSVCEEAREVLLATRQAELWHIVPRSKPVRFGHLEEIREMLKGD